MAEKIFKDPTRDNGLSGSDFSYGDYSVLYGKELWSQLSNEGLSLLTPRGNWDMNSTILCALVSICDEILEGGGKTGILWQGMLKRLILSSDIGVKAQYTRGRVSSIKLYYGKSVKDISGNDRIVDCIESIVANLMFGVPVSDIFEVVIELGFLYVSSIRIGKNYRLKDFAVTGNIYGDGKGHSVIRIAYNYPEPGLYDLDSKYRAVLSEKANSKIRNTMEWVKFSPNFNEDLSKIGKAVSLWTYRVINQKEVGGSVFLLRSRGSSVEVIDSVPTAVERAKSPKQSKGADDGCFRWSSENGLNDDTGILVSSILGSSFSQDFPDLHSIRWDVSILKKANFYYSKSLEEGTVDILITGYDPLTV